MNVIIPHHPICLIILTQFIARRGGHAKNELKCLWGPCFVMGDPGFPSWDEGEGGGGVI